MRNRYIYIWIILIFLTSCKRYDRFHIQHFEQEINVEVKRFDLDLINLDTNNIVADLELLEKKHPNFYPIFLENVLLMDTSVFSKDLDDPLSYSKEIKEFLQDTVFFAVHHEVKETFKDITQIEQQLSQAYSYLNHYFPEIELPELYFFVSGFNQAILISDSIMGVGSDLYLGADYPLYFHITHEYLTPNMRKEMIATDILKSIIYNYFAFTVSPNLLNSMLYEGKILYLLSVILPESTNDILIGYSTEELKWSKYHEKVIWSSIIEQKHLYSTDYFLINQYVNVAPFTSPISSESPGRLGVWMGWQIIQQYMHNNKDIDLQTLMANENYQQLLEQSGYRP